MSDDDYHRELADYEPGDGPVRNPAMIHVMRVFVVLGVVALVVPGILVTVGMQVQTADAACGIVVADIAPESVGSQARFEVLGQEGPGWYCYALQYGGSEILLRSLGLIPGLRMEPAGTPA